MNAQPPDLSRFHAGLFEVVGRWEIMRDDNDESTPEGYGDAEALDAIVRAATSGDRNAALALYLDGRPVDDERNFWPNSETDRD